MQSSKGMNNFVEIVKLKIIIKGRIYNETNNCMKRGAVLVLWRKFLLKIVENRPDRFMKCSSEKHLCKVSV